MPPGRDISALQKSTLKYIVFAGFETMDTQQSREALPNNRLAWCENLQIVGPNQLACTNGPMPPIVLITGEIITAQFFANFTPPQGVNTDFIISFCQSGAAYQTVVATGVTTKFALAGTFSTQPDMTVWSSQRLLIADPIAGYCTWDGHVFVQTGGVSPNFVITNGGSGYGAPPSVTISGGSGTGATAHSVLTGGVVTSVVLDTPGTGFKAGDTLTVTFGSGTAAATAIVWPIFSLTPTTLAVYAGRVWLAGSRVLTWTGTAGFDDAKAANAAGSTTITDADLVHQITALRSLNNFLYIFADNSIKQIGTVTVSGSVTIFNIVTLSSDQGTIFPRAIVSYNRLILFANKVGVYAILGASVEKISDQMDGIFSTLDTSQPLQAGVTDMHTALHTFLLLVRYKDPIAGITRSLILCFYKNRWFVANQGNGLTTICTVPISNTIETFSSSGNDVTQLFQSTSLVPIILRMSLSANNDIVTGKKGLRVAVAMNASTLSTLNGTADSENLNPGLPFGISTAQTIVWQNNSGQVITWRNNALQTITWAATGFQYTRAKIDSRGVFLGVTLSGLFAGGSGGGGTPGNAAGFIINSVVLEYQDVTDLTGRMNA
ncbi:MAG TPA: hypothetical protein VN325_23365 [Steroidobacteraceae bacterium]|nr:hypothetical protein [Steroidobacteraceae bacterium]